MEALSRKIRSNKSSICQSREHKRRAAENAGKVTKTEMRKKLKRIMVCSEKTRRIACGMINTQ